MTRRKSFISSASLLWWSTTVAFFSTSATICCALSLTKTTTTNQYHTNKVFIGGLLCNRDTLQCHLEQTYGSIQEIFIPSRKGSNGNHSETSPSYAFVTFDDPQHAQRAIQQEEEQSSNVNYYHDIQRARVDINQLRKEKRQNQDQLDWNHKEQIAKTSTILLQIATSHVARMEELLLKDYKNEVEIVGSCDTDSRSISLLGVAMKQKSENEKATAAKNDQPTSGSDANELQAWFQSLPFPLRGLNKVHAVNPLKRFIVTNHHYDNNDDRIESASNGTMKEVIRRLWKEVLDLEDNDGTDNSVRVRLNIFPPSLATQLFQELKDDTHKDYYHGVDVKTLFLNKLSPTDFTHSLDLIEITTHQGRQQHEQERLFLMETRSRTNDDNHKKNVNIAEDNIKLVNSKKEISRAYHKLQEAFFRYPHDLPSTSTKNNPFVAWDCGAAPGGWTKFLLDEIPDDLFVYSIDPGSLSPVVSNHPRVHHLAMTVEDAMEMCDSNGLGASKQMSGTRTVDIWVSDMCLHQMRSQVDLLLLARERKIIGTGAFFVLTLKCLVGRSKESFDAQVAEQRKRLEKCSCLDLEILHLFSNRSGERTIIGYFQ